jgi:hypothetical protein
MGWFPPTVFIVGCFIKYKKKWPERIFLLQQCLSFFPDLLRPLLESTVTVATTTTSATIRSLAATRSIQIQSAWSRALKGSFPTHPNSSRFQRTSIHPSIFMFLRFFIETKRHAFFPDFTLKLWPVTSPARSTSARPIGPNSFRRYRRPCRRL